MISAKHVQEESEKILNNEEVKTNPLFQLLNLILRILVDIRSNLVLPEEEKKRIYEEKKKRDAEITKKQ